MQTQIQEIIRRLTPFYPEPEAREMAYWIVEETTGMNRFDACRYACTKSIPNLEDILEKLCSYVPIQYIFGHCLWMGMDLQVSEAVLIPRPETAELVEHVSACMAGRTGRLLDVGTGSGCIALALKQRHPDWQIYALDISPAALQVARSNAAGMQTEITFLEADITNTGSLQSAGVHPHYDIIVSNPPYIRPSERQTMTLNTLRHEPSGALFVPEDDPLFFYRRIASLNIAAELWFEINEQMGNAMIALLLQYGYEAQCHQDMYGKDRFAYGRKTC